MLDFHSLPSNSAVMVKFKFANVNLKSIVEVNKNLRELNHIETRKIDTEDINHVLFRCEKEELDFSKKLRGNYDIQG